MEKLRAADTANVKAFFEESICADSEEELALNRSCNNVGNYESSLYKSFKGHRLMTRANSPYKPLTSYLNEGGILFLCMQPRGREIKQISTLPYSLN